jgi:hypothetical protein
MVVVTSVKVPKVVLNLRSKKLAVAVHIWNPDDWEAFSLNLLQHRHGHLNVHKIPAAHKGDFGLDFYCIKDAVAYQCYAVEEPVDISTRADRQKKKITADLAKVRKNAVEILKLFTGIRMRHWILLVPNHDSKYVNLHCSKKTKDYKSMNCPTLDVNFEVGIHDQSSFPSDIAAQGLANFSNVNLSVPQPTIEELSSWQASSSELLKNATHKLGKIAQPDQLNDLVSEATSVFLQGNALLDTLRDSAPDLHEKILFAISSRNRRLRFGGPSYGTSAGEVFKIELDAMADAIQKAAPSLSSENIEQISYGVVSEWIMRCPLDFPNA